MTIHTTTPPGDSLANFYGWAKAIDGEVLIKFFNEMAVYADPGYQDRLNILGRRSGWIFNIVFSEKGTISSAPLVGVTLTEGFPGSAIYETSIPLPPREVGETYAALTARWLQAAYTSLIGFNAEAGNPFTFSTGSVWYVDPDLTPAGTVLTLQDDWGIAADVWAAPDPWPGVLSDQPVILGDPTINDDGSITIGGFLQLPSMFQAVVIQMRLETHVGFSWINLWDLAGIPYPEPNQTICVVWLGSSVIIPGSPYPYYIENQQYPTIPLLAFSGSISRIAVYDEVLTRDAAVFLSLNPQ